MSEIVLIGITGINIVILLCVVKLYTEFAKQRMQETRRRDE
mgnify:CR=1 FL=1